VVKLSYDFYPHPKLVEALKAYGERLLMVIELLEER